MNDARNTASFVSSLADFSNVLAGSGLATYGIAFDYLHFGSWTIEVGTRHNRLLVQWDGKESLLSLSCCSIGDSQSLRDWTRVAEEPVRESITNTELFKEAEILIARFSTV